MGGWMGGCMDGWVKKRFLGLPTVIQNMYEKKSFILHGIKNQKGS